VADDKIAAFVTARSADNQRGEHVCTTRGVDMRFEEVTGPASRTDSVNLKWSSILQTTFYPQARDQNSRSDIQGRTRKRGRLVSFGVFLQRTFMSLLV
jgi:hypothetical protein